MNKEKIAIIGASGFGREVKMLIENINQKEPKYEIIGFFDDNKNLPENISGIPLLGTIDEINLIDNELNIALAIADPEVKVNILSRLNNENIKFPNLIDPNVISGNVNLGKGNIICAGNILTTDVTIKDFVILNLSCTVGHDTKIDSYCSFMPSVNISGNVYLEEKVYVGTGAKIINDLTIGNNTIVGAGAVVAKPLPANCTAVGIPAKPIKFNSKEK